MLEILFTSPKEARTIYSIFRKNRIENKSELQLLNDEVITINPTLWDVAVEKMIIPGFVQFICEHKEHEMMITLIKQDYYFKDEDEQHQILQIAYSIMEGERTDIPGIKEGPSRELLLRKILSQFLKPNLSFSYAAFQRFRLHPYIERLRDYVEVAIEEYKLEQEYQVFIHNIREYLVKRETKVHQLFLVHKEKEYILLNDQYRVLSEQELIQSIDQQFIYQHPMYIDSKLLAPLVSMAPNVINVYTDNQYDGMLHTIQNIFQERVTIHNLHEFKGHFKENKNREPS
ncbi:putative sporulation protein YtxC [Metabacillus sp. HB246100]